MSNFNVHYLEDANFKAAISEIKGFINHYHRGIFYVRFWHIADIQFARCQQQGFSKGIARIAALRR